MKDKVIDFKNIRRDNLPYILVWIFYYTWVIVFTTWWTSTPLTDKVYGADIRVYLHSVNLLASAVFIFLLKKDWFAPASRIGAVMLAVTASVFLFAPMSAGFQIAVIVLFGISLGLVNSGILIPFVFVMNNTEKFYSTVLSNLLICVLILLQTLGILHVTNGMLPSLIMLLFSLSFIFAFKKNSINEASPLSISLIPKTKKAIYMTLVINVIYAVFCKGIGHTFVLAADAKTSGTLDPAFYIGGITGCLIFFVIYCFARKSNQTAWNVTFGTFICAILLFLTDKNNDSLYYIFALLLGIGSTMGMINIYYILGVIGKKYWSMSYVRASILFIGIFGGISGIVLGKMVASYPDGVSIAVAAVSSAIFVIFLALSPTLSQSYFNEDWADDSRLPEIDNEKLCSFKKYGLTKRETEVCRLLLDGYTLRQISAILGIAYPTVNTYSTSLYRKTGINSRTELIILFNGKTDK